MEITSHLNKPRNSSLHVGGKLVLLGQSHNVYGALPCSTNCVLAKGGRKLCQQRRVCVDTAGKP